MYNMDMFVCVCVCVYGGGGGGGVVGCGFVWGFFFFLVVFCGFGGILQFVLSLVGFLGEGFWWVFF